MRFREVFDHTLTVWASIAGGVFVLVSGTLIAAIVLNRAQRRRRPLFQASKHSRVELAYASVLTATAAALILGSFAANAELGDGAGRVRAAGAPERIDVTAYQWCWDVAYQRGPVRETASCVDGDFPTIVVPAGRPVEFSLTSRDAVHSFWLPDFAVKRDAYPGHVNKLRMTFPDEGRYKGRCSEYCGTHHVTMDFFVQVVSPEEYQRYLDGGGVSA